MDVSIFIHKIVVRHKAPAEPPIDLLLLQVADDIPFSRAGVDPFHIVRIPVHRDWEQVGAFGINRSHAGRPVFSRAAVRAFKGPIQQVVRGVDPQRAAGNHHQVFARLLAPEHIGIPEGPVVKRVVILFQDRVLVILLPGQAAVLRIRHALHLVSVHMGKEGQQVIGALSRKQAGLVLRVVHRASRPDRAQLVRRQGDGQLLPMHQVV